MSNDPSETGRSPGGRPPEEQGALPNGVRPLDSLRVRDALQLGEEARDLARILQAKVPVATGYLVRLGDEQEARLRAVIADTLAAGNGVRLRPLFPTLGAAQRFERRLRACRTSRRQTRWKPSSASCWRRSRRLSSERRSAVRWRA